MYIVYVLNICPTLYWTVLVVCSWQCSGRWVCCISGNEASHNDVHLSLFRPGLTMTAPSLLGCQVRLEKNGNPGEMQIKFKKYGAISPVCLMTILSEVSSFTIQALPRSEGISHGDIGVKRGKSK